MKSPDDDLLASLGALAREEHAAADAVPAPVRPLDEGLRNRLMAVARAGVRREAEDASEEPIERERVAEPKVVRTKRGGVFAFTVAGTLAIAALVAVYVTTRDPQREQMPLVATRPAYDLEVSGGIAADRGEPAAVVLAEGAPITLSLRPATRYEGAVEARAWLVRDGVAKPLPLAATIAPGGALRLTGTLVTGGMAEGPAEIVVSIGQPGAVHAIEGTPETQILRAPIVVGAR